MERDQKLDSLQTSNNLAEQEKLVLKKQLNSTAPLGVGDPSNDA